MKKLFTLIVCLCSTAAFSQYNWMRWDTFPGPNLPQAYNSSVFTAGDYTYMFGISAWDTSSTKGVRYHAATKTWRQLPTHPAAHRSGVLAFHHNGYFYCGFGEDSLGNFYNDLYKMDTTTGVWVAAGAITDTVFNNGLHFEINNKIYIAAANLSEIGTNTDLGTLGTYMWEYNPANNVFTRKATYPKKSIYLYQFNNGSRYFMGGGFTNGLSTYPSTYEYDYTNDAWVEKAPFPGWVSYSPPGNFTRGNYGYVYCGGGQDSTGFNVTKPHMLRYDMANDQWAITDTFPFAYDYARFNFMVGDDVYFCALNSDPSVVDGMSYQFYKYTADTLTSIPIAYADKNGLLAYPNPAPSGTPFTLIQPFDTKGCRYLLNDITGKEYAVTVDVLDGQTVTLRPQAGTAKGVYFLRVLRQNTVYPVKLFID